jgi:hypothetical protein
VGRNWGVLRGGGTWGEQHRVGILASNWLVLDRLVSLLGLSGKPGGTGHLGSGLWGSLHFIPIPEEGAGGVWDFEGSATFSLL